MAPADAELVARSRNADAEAFGEIVERHQQLVFGIALARCHDPALAEDVAQEAFVTAWRDLGRLRDGDRVGPWVAGIARNLASNAVRRRIRNEAAIADLPANDAATPLDDALEREDRELLHRALADVPDSFREVLVLYYLQGESVADIASSLRIREDLVKQRLSRGRSALRDSVATRVETALSRARLKPAFRAGVVAALAVGGARNATAATTAGKVILGMSMQKLAIAAAAVVAIGGAAVWLSVRAKADKPAPHATPAAKSLPTAPASPAASKPHVERIADPKQRAQLREEIRDAREHRTVSSSTSGGTSSSTPRPALAPGEELDKAYIRASVREILPMLGDCYAEGLERNPKLEGTIVVNFTIEGEPGVASVIGESKVDLDASQIKDPTVTECIQETMYALKIDAPPSGGIVHVTYPFLFAPAPPP